VSSDVEALAAIAVDCGLKLHQILGPGLLESVYESYLFQDLVRRGLTVTRQQVVPIVYDGLTLDELWRSHFQRGAAPLGQQTLSSSSLILLFMPSCLRARYFGTES
jgi:hypothetical protein